MGEEEQNRYNWMPIASFGLMLAALALLIFTLVGMVSIAVSEISVLGIVFILCLLASLVLGILTIKNYYKTGDGRGYYLALAAIIVDAILVLLTIYFIYLFLTGQFVEAT